MPDRRARPVAPPDRDRTVDELVEQEGDVLAELARRRARHPKPSRLGRQLCPSCGTSWIAATADDCIDCERRRERRDREKKTTWWHDQDDYQLLRRRHGAREACRLWLRHQFRKDDRIATADLTRRATRVGISVRTLERARADLDVQVVRGWNHRRGVPSFHLELTEAVRHDASLGGVHLDDGEDDTERDPAAADGSSDDPPSTP